MVISERNETVRMIVDALCTILTNHVLEEGRELDGKVAFEAKHNELLVKIPE